MLSWLLACLFSDVLFFFGHLSSSSSFPKKLSPQEEETALKELLGGSEEARQKLIRHNLRLVVHIARKYSVSGYTQDDLISVGSIGLIKAIGTYKPEMGTGVCTYAARCIENEIRMLLRASKKWKNEISLQEPIGNDGEGNEITLMDTLGSERDSVITQVDKKLTIEKIKEAVKQLPTRERTVMEMRYGILGGKMYPQRDIAKALGISRSYVSRVEKRAIELLREQTGEIK
ncbi:MAG: RNA polymerase sporulation sigma factor SigK [Eubacteriales bacterium]|nr:RNA polymerase sporulation sigma factor SigK [Eubacteriales bacterium]MDD3882212.1 RNA polymerase sporulation sigma factor SigK [Eubacteriales bacterium]MDD4512561.1 RNA polymerase sporulation sigma factor SigK [Eubacteriales bacterium]